MLKRGQIDRAVRGAVEYVLGAENKTSTDEGKAILDLSGDALQEAAGKVLSDYFDANRHSGVTCDFGGIAFLIEENQTLADDDSLGLDDDEYFRYVEVRTPAWIIALIIVGAVLVGCGGGIVGFIFAMRNNQKFNQRIRETALFNPLTKTTSKMIRSTCALDDLAGGECTHLVPKGHDHDHDHGDDRPPTF